MTTTRTARFNAPLVALLGAITTVPAAYAADSVSISLTSLRIQNALNQSRSSSPATIDPAFKYSVAFSEDTAVRGSGGLLGILYSQPVPLADLLETFSPGSSAALSSVVLNPSGTHPVSSEPTIVTGAANGATITLTLQSVIDVTNVASFTISNVTLTPTLVGSLVFTSGSVTISRGCIGDFNDDGGVDGADVEAFYTAWAAAETNADTNGDGGVDGGDVEAFFARWQTGC
jgi:hypothetical protein